MSSLSERQIDASAEDLKKYTLLQNAPSAPSVFRGERPSGLSAPAHSLSILFTACLLRYFCFTVGAAAEPAAGITIETAAELGSLKTIPADGSTIILII